MNETGFYHFRCWKGRDRQVIGQKLSIYEYQAYINAGWHLTSFPGRRATILILIEDLTITRADILQFAINFMEGKLIEISYDLDRCTTTRTNVHPPP